MTDTPEIDPDRPSLGDIHKHLSEFMAFLPELNKESDRGMTMIATSFIDELLKRTISAFLVEGPESKLLLDGFGAPLGTFSSRIKMAIALGLLNRDEAKDTDILRTIRNDFAHRVHISFSDSSIKDRCLNLQLAAKDYGSVTVNTRTRFLSSATAIILNLTNRAHYASLERLTSRSWGA